MVSAHNRSISVLFVSMFCCLAAAACSDDSSEMMSPVERDSGPDDGRDDAGGGGQRDSGTDSGASCRICGLSRIAFASSKRNGADSAFQYTAAPATQMASASRRTRGFAAGGLGGSEDFRRLGTRPPWYRFC